jgi:RNA polymerase sigma-70 factor (ECF subfamily)
VSDEALLGATTLTPEALARGYAHRVYRYACLVYRSRVDSEDLAQEALLKAMRSLDQFDPARGSLESWLWRIVVNVARDGGRASTRAEALWERIVLHFTAATEDVESIALRRISDAQLLEEVNRLPRRSRSLIALRFGGDLSYEEIGELLHENPAALRQAIHRALKALRIRLEETHDPDP